MKNLKTYSNYIRLNLLRDYVEESIKLTKSMDIPLMRFFKDLSDEQLIEMSIISTTEFLLSIENDTAFERAEASLKLWEEDKLPGIAKGDIHPSDLVLIYSLQKKVLYSFLTGYTKKANEAIKIVLEFESFHTKIQNEAFKLHHKIQKDTEKKLKEREEKLDAIFNNAPDAIIAADLQFNITEWNKAAEQMYGYTKEEVIGKSARELLKVEYNTPVTREKAIKEMEATGVWIGELIHSTPRRNNIIVLSSNCYLKDESGIINGYLGVHKDITEVKRVQQELHKSEAMYHLLVDEVIDYAIIIIDTEGKILTWSKGAEKIKGYKEEEILGKNFSIFYTEEDKEMRLPEKTLKTILADGRYTNTGWRLRKNKSKFWADVVITKLSDENGNILGFAKITRDLSERKEAEDEIITKTEELNRSNAELEQFAYVASHDLQEPLRTVTSYVQLLASRYKDKLDQDANEFIDFAVDGSNRMRNLIASLLEYSRVSRIKPFEQINMNQKVADVLKDLNAAITESHAKITVDKLPDIFGDSVLIDHLLNNLISNALKFNTGKPEIFISGKKMKDEYLFSIKDNGIGIQKEYSEKIFVIFQRLHSKDKFPGTGIGLSVCKKIVERHNGKIWVESEPGKGATFYFTIKKTH